MSACLDRAAMRAEIPEMGGNPEGLGSFARLRPRARELMG